MFEIILTILGRMVNDLSLLQIDVIKSTNIKPGEAVARTVTSMGDGDENLIPRNASSTLY